MDLIKGHKVKSEGEVIALALYKTNLTDEVNAKDTAEGERWAFGFIRLFKGDSAVIRLYEDFKGWRRAVYDDKAKAIEMAEMIAASHPDLHWLYEDTGAPADDMIPPIVEIERVINEQLDRPDDVDELRALVESAWEKC